MNAKPIKHWDISLLYVEDEPILRNIYQNILGKQLRQLLIAEHGEEGFEMYVQHQPDLVITDVKMPVMNGLDMAYKIRKHYPNARIIILSAYSEVSFFTRAIENGIKSYLIKPVTNERLFQVIDEQAREILLEKSVKVEEEKRIKAEADLSRNESILQAISTISEILLRQSLDKLTINELLKILGMATKVSRVYIFETILQDQATYICHKFEWVGEGIEPQIDNPELKMFRMDEEPFARWIELARQNKPIFGLVSSFTAEERTVLESQQIVSLLVLPIFSQGKLYGLMGYDDCVNEREWTQVETNTLATAASILGAAIERSRIEEELRKFNIELEYRVDERTKNLQTEIKERKLAEKLLRNSEEKYRNIFENANDGILLSVDEQVQFINPMMYEITGFLPKMIMGKPFTDFVHPDFKALVINNYQKRISGEEAPESYDIKIVDAKNQSKWVEIKSNLISWDNTKAVLIFIRDIDTRKKYEKELEILNKKLEERVKQELAKIEKQQQYIIQKSKLESLGELAAGMAHELNQPIGGISLSMDNLLHRLNDNTMTAEYLKSKINLVFSDIQRIQELINHIRLFSRDQESLANEAFAAHKAIDNTLLMINRLFIHHKINLLIDLDIQHAQLYGNPLRLEQVLLNVLTNAKHAVEEKALRLNNEYIKSITIKSYLQAGNLIIKITDNGIGIPAEKLDRIFDPFFTTKQAEEGTGLGLSISYGIVKNMKGLIKAESVLNEYTTITISIPEYTK
jgi:PAS domain S-box-containing protein